VLLASPVSATLTAVSLLPVTGLWSAVTVDPYATVVPYSKVTVIESPLALTVPFNVAPVDPTAVAAPVVAVGAEALVVNET
jgi:hypothetical protein